MELQEIQGLEKVLLKDIEEFMLKYSKITEKSEDEISEKEYEELKSLRTEYKKISGRLYSLENEKNRIEKIIQKVDEGKKLAPLVPIKEVVEAVLEEITLEEYEKEEKCYGEITSFFSSDKYTEFSRKEIDEKIEKYIKEYESNSEKQKMEYEREKKRKQIEELIFTPGPVKGMILNLCDPMPTGKSYYYTTRKSMVISEKARKLIGLGANPDWLNNWWGRSESVEVIREGSYQTMPDLSYYVYSKLDYTPYEQCDLLNKQECKAYEESFIEAQKKAEEEENYDEPGVISISGEDISVSQRVLFEAGILPEELGWQPTKILSKDIAEADKEKGLTTREMGGIKGLIKRLFEKIKGRDDK